MGERASVRMNERSGKRERSEQSEASSAKLANECAVRMNQRADERVDQYSMR